MLYVDWEGRERDFVLHYENLKKICFICGLVDHVEKDSLYPATTAGAAHQFDAWMCYKGPRLEPVSTIRTILVSRTWLLL